MALYIELRLLLGKVYVGQTVKKLDTRKSEHLSAAHKKDHRIYNTKFSRAIRKYKNNLVWEIIFEDIPVNLLDDYEIWSIGYYDSYNSGYNLTLGGEGNRGYVPTEKTRKKLSKSQKGKG